MIPFCNGTKFLTSVTTENKFIIPDHAIIINKDQKRNEGIETSKIYPSDETNPMDYHRNTLIYSDEWRSKDYKPDRTKNIILVTPDDIGFITPEDKFICHAQVIMTSRDQGRKLGLDISMIFIDHVSNIICRHRNALLPDEDSNNFS